MTLLVTVALAQQLSHTAESRGDEVALAWSWRDADKAVQRVDVAFPRLLVEADAAVSTTFPSAGCLADVSEAIRREARRWSGLRVEITPTAPCNTSFRAVAPSSTLPRAMAALTAARTAAHDAWLAEHGYVAVGGEIRPNHVAFIREYVEAVRPLADALAMGGDDDRSYAERALNFVQSIPYERVDGSGAGYRRPLSVLVANRGDCDSKSVLFLALLRARLPDLRSAMVYVPHHAYVAIGIYGGIADERVLLPDGTDVPIAEPVGPAILRVGQAGARSTAPEELRLVVVP